MASHIKMLLFIQQLELDWLFKNKMKRLIIILLFFSILFLSCSKEETTGEVKYHVSCATVPFNVSYDNIYGNYISENVNVEPDTL